ncbi:MAG: GTP cyclohydrolase II [Candidatus Peregrinibacteria bacterium Greene0416_62]|nr:MAG: GTP cyclohydrolase II [Candidatus Peregrinibacteria bacterium Greene0416_62]TSC99548.1 MAG: GTP cyclohydrolase II [Candidatus Peregrinibacteria bacterium Greene1014_49]
MNLVKPEIRWGASSPDTRGYVLPLGDTARPDLATAVGNHHGPYSTYHASGKVRGLMNSGPNFDEIRRIQPAVEIGPFGTWVGEQIASLDPFGANATRDHPALVEYGLRSTISVIRNRFTLDPTLMERWGIQPDGNIVSRMRVTDLPIHQIPTHLTDETIRKKEWYIAEGTHVYAEPVWHMPTLEKRLHVPLGTIADVVGRQRRIMRDLVDHPDLEIMLPSIEGPMAFVFGDPKNLGKEVVPVTGRVHYKCKTSDVFDTDRCTCRPYLLQAWYSAIAAAQRNEIGVVVFLEEEGKAGGPLDKYGIYGLRDQQEDRPQDYLDHTTNTYGYRDLRFYEVMGDMLKYLGITHLDTIHSQSQFKARQLELQGIRIGNMVPLDPELIPPGAYVEYFGKQGSGHYGGNGCRESHEDSQLHQL